MAAPQTALDKLRQSIGGPRDEDLYKCVHCGLCLNVCPTYLETGLETESPRGRIALMKAVREERVGLTPRVVSHMDMCLQCRACEVVCPSGVPFGRLMEATREQIAHQRKAPLLRRLALRLAFRHLLPHPGRVYALGAVVRLYQRTPMWRLMRRFPGVLGRLNRQLPALQGSFFRPSREAYAAEGAVRARVGVLSGCVMALSHGSTMEAVVRVLARNGCQVVVPPGQACCGALNIHGGDRTRAQEMARRNIDVFLEQGVDTVIVASAGCGSTMKEYGNLLGDDPQYAEKAERFGSLVKDVAEFLVGLPFTQPKGSITVRVTYQDPCHLAHAQRITEAPRQLLGAIPGVELVEMESSSQCCGAAGLYGSLQPEMSRRLMERKVATVMDTGVEVMATTNPGCALQMEMGLKEAGSGTMVRYVVDLLDESYGRESEGA